MWFLFRFGCMHLLATNLNMWLHVVVKESISEINHAEHEQEQHGQANLTIFQYSDEDGPPACDGSDSEILGYQKISQINVYLYPFAIEFTLIGAIFFYTMYKKIGYM